MATDPILHPTGAETNFLDRFFASAFCRKLPLWLGGATLIFLALAFLAYRSELRPLRDIVLLGLAAGSCFCAMCVFLDSDSSSGGQLVGLFQVFIGSLLIAAGIFAFLPGPTVSPSKPKWDELVRGTAPKLKKTEPWQRLTEYTRKDEKAVLRYTGGTTKRSVSESLKKAIYKRDGHQCVICSAEQKMLEVDHRRALMNGGSNEPTNLALLCVDCHKEKTAIDKSIRRGRENLQKRKNKNPKKSP